MNFSGANIVIKSLRDLGVEYVFGYPGGAILPIYDEIFKQNKIRHILVRHEQGAVHMAEGYARSTGNVGVVLVTSGPGATNAVTGLTDALMDSVPILCLTGQVPTHLIGTDAFQEADTLGITRSCTKHNFLVKSADKLQKTIFKGFQIARNGRPGPVVIDLPKDVQNDQTTYIPNMNKRFRSSYSKKNINNSSVNKDHIDIACQLIIKSKKPIVYIGGGLINSGANAIKELKNFSILSNFPITSTLMGLGAFPASNNLFLGMLGMHGTYEANMAMHDCDLMINIGARFDDRITGRLDKFSPKSKKIHIDIDPSSINKNVLVDIGLIGDAGKILNNINKKLKTLNFSSLNQLRSNWWKTIKKWRRKDCLNFTNSKEIIKPQHALKVLNNKIKDKDFFITTEVGQHQMWAAQFIGFDKPNRWMTSGGLGTMGYGFPASIGVQIANPESLVICVAGEASFLMNMQELSTLKQYNLPVKVFIMNNRYLGMVRQWQEFFHGKRYSESYSDSLPDFVKLAESFGIKGMRVDHPEKLNEALDEMINHKGPVLADICVDKAENVFPMIPSGAAHNEMKLSDKDKVPTSTKKGKMLV
ncbi:MAG: Acetolactate synthase isozyme 3 large subunit [Alphaproteobacteria bacterium MarineAlpha9_Bin4]|nr:acetolactate synthase, large subunit, biosynthetic type [Pelagibacterales bacterium]PPR25978.1 MAG: Acetolactate synthase isozyme 3 large subunit [Alphaproteobacteria bacterium MarineAlpha9_Bin4]